MKCTTFKPGDLVATKDAWAGIWKKEVIGYRPTSLGQSMLVVGVHYIGGEDEVYHLEVFVDGEIWTVDSTNVKLVSREK